MKDDLTIIFLTVNLVPEKWAEYHKQVLLEAIGDTPIITISKKPLDWGLNLIQEGEPSIQNIYRQILRGAKLATTPYIAIAEDDVLYPKEHFLYRPPLDTFAYDFNRLGLFTWGKPTYYCKARISNSALIAPRQLTIDALEERFAKYPNHDHIGELGNEKKGKLISRKVVHYYSTISMIFLSHVKALDPLERSKRKRPGVPQAYDVPRWGRAEEVVKKFK